MTEPNDLAERKSNIMHRGPLYLAGYVAATRALALDLLDDHRQLDTPDGLDAVGASLLATYLRDRAVELQREADFLAAP